MEDDAEKLYDHATSEIKKAHDEGKVLQKEIMELQEKKMKGENEVTDASQKEAAALSGKKQTETWIAARAENVAAAAAKKKEEEKEKAESQGTFECEDGTMVFDSVNCPDAGPGAKERAAVAKKIMEDAKKKQQEEEDKLEVEAKEKETASLEEFTKALTEAQAAKKTAETTVKTVSKELVTKIQELEGKNKFIDEKEKVRAEQSVVISESRQKSSTADLEWRSTKARHEAITDGLKLRKDEALTSASIKKRELEDFLTLKKASNKDEMKKFKIKQEKEMELLKERIKEAVILMKKQIEMLKESHKEMEKEITTRTTKATEEADVLMEQVRNVAKSSKETLKARGKQKMETLEAQKGEAEEAAEMEKTRSLEVLRSAASLEVTRIHEWKTTEDKQEKNIVDVLAKEIKAEVGEETKASDSFASLEAELMTKEASLAKATAAEDANIAKARAENFKLEELRTNQPSAEALENELDAVKMTLSKTLGAKKVKAEAEQEVAVSYSQIQQEGMKVEQEDGLRQQELEKMVAQVTPPSTTATVV